MTGSHSGKAPPPARGAHYMYGLDILRVVCAFAVIYTHVMSWAVGNDYASPIIDIVEDGLVAPLHLKDRLSFIGVCAFLLITGAVIAHVAGKETRAQFGARRAVRLVPTLWIAMAVAALLGYVGLFNEGVEPSIADVVRNMLLINHATPQSVGLLGVTWTLFCQVIFYLYVAVTIPLARRWPWLPVALGACLLALLGSLVTVVPWQYTGALRMIATFLPIIFIGQTITLTRNGKLTPPIGVTLAAAHLLLGIRATGVWPDQHSAEYYLRTLTLLVLVMLLLTRTNGTVARSAAVRVISKRTYGIYLFHTPIMIATLNLTASHLGFHAALLLALVALAIVLEAVYRVVDEPINRRYSRWEARRNRVSRYITTR